MEGVIQPPAFYMPRVISQGSGGYLGLHSTNSAQFCSELCWPESCRLYTGTCPGMQAVAPSLRAICCWMLMRASVSQNRWATSSTSFSETPVLVGGGGEVSLFCEASTAWGEIPSKLHHAVSYLGYKTAGVFFSSPQGSWEQWVWLPVLKC